MTDNQKIEKQLEIILQQQETMQKSIDRIDRDMGEDRKKIDSLEISNSGMIDQMESIRNLFAKQTIKIRDAITEITQPIIDETQDLKDVIAEKKVIAIDVKKTKDQKKHWYKLWR